ncbi:family 78 glycoside hydrolase catalytic domain [Rathayibacter sp. CAU 1779]
MDIPNRAQPTHTVPHALRVDSGGDDVPTTTQNPRLSWLLPDDIGASATTQLQADISGRLVDTRLPGADHLFVPWPWPSLHSRDRVRWRVRVTDDVRITDWSEWATFEVGLLNADWQADWISVADDSDSGPGNRPGHTFATSFKVDAPVSRARLYATALGVYEAFVNDSRSGTAQLSPGNTSYDHTLYAQASDVTSALHEGTNRLEVTLSDGWYRGEVGAFRIPAEWGSTPGIRAELHIDYTDGTTQIVRTDQTWTSTPSPIIRASLMNGQTTDLTSQPHSPVPVRVGQADAPAISWSPAPPVRVIETRAPAAAQQIADGVWVVDFAQNASGWVLLSDLGPEGTRTIIDYGEHLSPDGDLDTHHLDSIAPDSQPIRFVQHDEVIAGPQPNDFEPRHTVHGFRYARIQRAEAPFDPASIRMRIVHTDLQRTGTFACSNSDLTRLHEIADWSFRGNAVDVPTDCPTRERLAWTGDYQVFAPTATRLYDVLGFTRKWLQSVRDDQLDDGRIPNFAPDGRRIKHHLDDRLAMMTGSSGWGDAIIAVPWEMYRAYGDTAVLIENWDAMTRWMEWVLENARTTRHASRMQRSEEPQPHEEYLWDGSFHWGEWAEPQQKAADGTRIDPIQHNPMAWFMADKGEVGTAYLHRSASTLSRIARILGDPQAEQRYSEVAERAREAWQTEYLDAYGRTADDTQASYVRALAFDLIPDHLREAAAGRLAELIRATDNHLTTGFLSTGMLLPVLAETGHADLAYDLLLQRTPPSWLYMLDNGATTVWEDWEGIDENGTAHDSLNHYSKGSVIRFLHTHVLGLRQDENSAAWESFTIAPVPHPTLTWAEGTLDTPQGTIAVRWGTDGDNFTISAQIPAGCTTRLRMPDGTTEQLSAGVTTRTGILGALSGEFR